MNPRKDPTVKTCDNASVGVLIYHNDGRLLTIERGTAPAGLAPPSGHVFDDHSSYEEAARAEALEEVGLVVGRLELLTDVWRPNRCRRVPGPDGVGHHWLVYRAEVAVLDLSPSAREVRSTRWLTPDEIHAHAHRTLAYARGQISETDWRAAPGIEPVWVSLLLQADMLTLSDMSANDLRTIAATSSAPIEEI